MTPNTTMENPLARYWQIIVVLVAGGIAWGSINTDVAMLKKAVAEEAAETTEQEEKIVEIDKKLVRIETTQEQIKDDVEQAAKTAKENARKLDRILNKLEED